MVSYRVRDEVKTHDAYGLGAYRMNMVNDFYWNPGFAALSAPGLRFLGIYSWSFLKGG